MLPHANLLLLKTVIKNLKPNSLETDALSDRQGIRCPFRKCIIDYYEPKIAVAFDRSKRKKENEICRRLGDYYDFCKRINLDFLYVVTGLENMADILLYSDFVQHEIEVTLPTELKMSDYFYTYFHKNFQSYITILSFDAYKYIKNY